MLSRACCCHAKCQALIWLWVLLLALHVAHALQALISFELLEQRYQYAFYMHADDDSYVRLDLMLQLLVREQMAMSWSACRTAQQQSPASCS